MRFIHTADWQLGKAFGRFDPEVRAALREARYDVIDTIGKLAAESNVGDVLVAGDVFDTEWPEDRTIVQAVSRMQRHQCHWWLLPGNHDFARNTGLWDRVKAKQAANITVLDKPQPEELTTGVWLLPAPLAFRRNLDDPTSLYDTMETPGANIRIGIAHGSIRGFGSNEETNNLIAIDRAKRSALDYLALGDWHGTLEVDARTWYSGTPETDRFGRDEPGHSLLVEILPGEHPPKVTSIRTGRFQWLERSWVANDTAAFLAASLNLFGTIEASASLLKLKVSGIASLGDRLAMLNSLQEDIRHRVRFLEANADDLVATPSAEDMAELAVEGTLGIAAAKLSARIDQGGVTSGIAKRALERLFVEYARGAQS